MWKEKERIVYGREVSETSVVEKNRSVKREVAWKMGRRKGKN